MVTLVSCLNDKLNELNICFKDTFIGYYTYLPLILIVVIYYLGDLINVIN